MANFVGDLTGGASSFGNTGHLSPWEVFATGINFNCGSGGPLVSAINAQIVLANADGGNPVTSSIGWVNTSGGVGAGTGFLEFGEPNDSNVGLFQQVCVTGVIPMGTAPRWMWYNSNPPSNPFNTNPPGGGGHKEYLIFRVRITDLTDVGGAPAPAVSAWGVGALALLLLTGVAIKFGRRQAVPSAEGGK